jgi:hypothetical protein
MKSNQLRLVIEIILGIGLASSLLLTLVISVSNNDLDDQVLAFKKQAQEAELALHKQRTEMRLEKDVVVPERQVASKAELEAIKSAFSNGVVLQDLETYYKSQKNWSTDRQVGVATLQLLANGGRDEATIASIQKALDMAELGLQKNAATKTPASSTR